MNIDDLPTTSFLGTKKGWVYLCRTPKGFKIGRTQKIKQRMKNLEKQHGDIELLDYLESSIDNVALELMAHRIFNDKLVYGREYFDLNKDDIALFKTKFFLKSLEKKANKHIDYLHDRFIKNAAKPIILALNKKARILRMLSEADDEIDRTISLNLSYGNKADHKDEILNYSYNNFI